MYGWAGKILRVDLTGGKFEVFPTSDYIPTYLGGRGIGARIYWEEVPPDVSAFDPENRLIFMTGPLQGTLAPTSAVVSWSSARLLRPLLWRHIADLAWEGTGRRNSSGRVLTPSWYMARQPSRSIYGSMTGRRR